MGRCRAPYDGKTLLAQAAIPQARIPSAVLVGDTAAAIEPSAGPASLSAVIRRSHP
jgi:hypothetical protein